MLNLRPFVTESFRYAWGVVL